MKDLAPDIVRQRLLIEGLYSRDVDRAAVEAYLIDVAAHLGLRTLRAAHRACAGRRGGGGKPGLRRVHPADRLRDLALRLERRSGFSPPCCSPANVST